jgi:hypothetical protein
MSDRLLTALGLLAAAAFFAWGCVGWVQLADSAAARPHAYDCPVAP